MLLFCKDCPEEIVTVGGAAAAGSGYKLTANYTVLLGVVELL